MEISALEKMVELAEKIDADVVVADHYSHRDGKRFYSKAFDGSNGFVTDKEADIDMIQGACLLYGKLTVQSNLCTTISNLGAPWQHLYRKSIIEERKLYCRIIGKECAAHGIAQTSRCVQVIHGLLLSFEGVNTIHLSYNREREAFSLGELYTVATLCLANTPLRYTNTTIIRVCDSLLWFQLVVTPSVLNESEFAIWYKYHVLLVPRSIRNFLLTLLDANLSADRLENRITILFHVCVDVLELNHL